MAKPAVFVDSSVMIAALLSSEGGSFHVLTESKDLFAFQINEYVFVEIQEILRTEFADRPGLTTDLFLLIGIAGIVILPNPTKRQVLSAAQVVAQNDAPILAAALRSSDFLITLDNGFLSASVLARAQKRSLAIMKPKQFLERQEMQRAA